MRKAKSQLSKLVRAACKGEEVLIANNSVPIVRLVKIDAPKVKRQPGLWAGLENAAADWDSPITNSEIADAVVR